MYKEPPSIIYCERLLVGTIFLRGETVEGTISKLKRALGFGMPTRVTVDDPDACKKVAAMMLDHMERLFVPRQPLTLLCIGTDRSTGDCLGPLVGTGLARLNLPGVTIYGTLESPVHAGNLDDTLRDLSPEEREAVIAIDACLGKADNVGTISVRSGPLSPGSGVNKKLPQVGHFHIVGVVNVGGFMEYFVLQNTRLNIVMRLSEVLISGIRLAILEHFGLYSPAQTTPLYPFPWQEYADEAVR